MQPTLTAAFTVHRFAHRAPAPWQLYDNGLAFEAFEAGREVADGTLRP